MRRAAVLAMALLVTLPSAASAIAPAPVRFDFEAPGAGTALNQAYPGSGVRFQGGGICISGATGTVEQRGTAHSGEKVARIDDPSSCDEPAFFASADQPMAYVAMWVRLCCASGGIGFSRTLDLFGSDAEFNEVVTRRGVSVSTDTWTPIYLTTPDGTARLTSIALGPVSGQTFPELWVDDYSQSPTLQPDTELTSTPATVTTSRVATFGFVGNGGTAFSCALDGGTPVPCQPGVTYSALPDGPHNISVANVNELGITDATPATFSWTVVTAPAPVIAAPVVADADRDTVPDAADNCRMSPNTNQADKDGDKIGDACDDSDGSLPPVAGTRIQATVTEGEVYYKPPGRSTRSHPATAAAKILPLAGFIPLKGNASVPVGSQLDTRGGVMTVRTSAGTASRAVQTATVRAGIFQIAQRKGRKVTTDLKLRPRSRKGFCPAKKRSAKQLAKLETDAPKGQFRSIGQASKSFARAGARFVTEDRCDGTRTRVLRGTVAVRDDVLKKTVNVKAGGTYLARLQAFQSKAKSG